MYVGNDRREIPSKWQLNPTVVNLSAEKKVHYIRSITRKLLSSYCKPNEGSTLDGFPTKETKLWSIGVLHDKFHTGHEALVVRAKVSLQSICHRSHRRH